MKAPPSTAFKRLALATAISTFVLIIVGGIVRVSDSGLGCGPGGSGFHGWPFCNGDVVPGVRLAFCCAPGINRAKTSTLLPPIGSFSICALGLHPPLPANSPSPYFLKFA